MRRLHLIGLAGFLMLGMVVVASPVVAEHGDPVTVNGTVTGLNGTPATDAVVLIGEDSTLTGFSPAELRAFAADPPQNLTAVEVGRNGRFEVTLGSFHAEAAVAVSESGISDLVYIQGENATLSLDLYERRPQTVHAHLGTITTTEQRATLYVNLGNSGDTAVETLSVQLGSLPDGWSVASVTMTGSYHPSNRTLTWATIPPGVEVETTVVLSIPEETPIGEYTVGLRATSESHRIDVESEILEVVSEDTPTPMRTPFPNESDTTPTTKTESTETSGTPSDEASRTTESSETASGLRFGAVIAVGVIAIGAALLVRRE